MQEGGALGSASSEIGLCLQVDSAQMLWCVWWEVYAVDGGHLLQQKKSCDAGVERDYVV